MLLFPASLYVVGILNFVVRPVQIEDLKCTVRILVSHKPPSIPKTVFF